MAFDKPLVPTGGMEIWMGEVERRMRSSVRAAIVAAMAAYSTRCGGLLLSELPACVFKDRRGGWAELCTLLLSCCLHYGRATASARKHSLRTRLILF